MEPWVRKVLAIPVVAAGLIICVAAIGAARANDANGRDGPATASERAFGLDYVPVRGDTVEMAVRQVVLQQNGKTYMAATAEGLTVKNQDILPLARIPFLSQITDAPYERAAFADEHRVAGVLAHNETLFVTLPKETPLPNGVVIFNQNNAFFLNEKPSPSESLTTPAGPAVAQAFFHPEEQNLLIMVRPSIILDGALF